jgi:hypothetical protein
MLVAGPHHLHASCRTENHMSQQDDPKGPENAENAELDNDALDQVSGGAFDAFLKLDKPGTPADFIIPSP